MSDTQTMTLTDFLLARIAEDEEAVIDMECQCDIVTMPDCPDRVLAECEAKRRIVELHRGDDTHECPTLLPSGVQVMEHVIYCDTLRALASVYADHPEFRAGWRA